MAQSVLDPSHRWTRTWGSTTARTAIDMAPPVWASGRTCFSVEGKSSLLPPGLVLQILVAALRALSAVLAKLQHSDTMPIPPNGAVLFSS